MPKAARKMRPFSQEELDGMSRDELEESLILLEELDQRAKRRAIWKYYPEDGPLSRHNYPKHIAFLNAGAKYRERLLISANRIGKCLTSQTLIDTPVGRKTVGELYAAGKPFKVYAWDVEAGERVIADAGVPFKKGGKEPCVRFNMRDGQWAEMALNHRILTDSGWAFVSDILSRCAEPSYFHIPDTKCDMACKGNRIVLAYPVGFQDVYDFEVKKYHNYIAGGLVHHNTEGIGGYEVALHLIGIYPDWWEGKRFKQAVRVWVAGDTAKTTRDIIQAKLFGPSGREGEGLIPGHTIIRTTKKPGTPDAIDQAWIRHKSGQASLLTLKSYDQRREAFQGTEQEFIWLDEEPPLSIYSECVMRTMTTQGLIIMTFTPLMGVTEVVKLFMPDGTLSSAVNVG